MKTEFRTERDSMGEMQVPADAYYGAQTARAVENFPISTLRFGRSFIRALALVKLAAAKANSELGLLPGKKAEAICQAAREVADGKLDGESVHPNDDVNMSQSTNDVFPTAIHVAALEAIERNLLPALGVLAEA